MNEKTGVNGQLIAATPPTLFDHDATQTIGF